MNSFKTNKEVNTSTLFEKPPIDLPKELKKVQNLTFVVKPKLSDLVDRDQHGIIKRKYAFEK